MNKKYFGAAALSFLLFAARSAAFSGTEEKKVTIRDEYQEKIVYTFDPRADTAPLEKDCAQRDGKFNACGSPCPPHAQMCPSVCAFTCEFEKK